MGQMRETEAISRAETISRAEREYWEIALQDLRRTARLACIDILALLKSFRGMTRRQLSKEMGRGDNGLFPLLKLMRERGLVVRKRQRIIGKRNPAFVYSLRPIMLDGKAICATRTDEFTIKRITCKSPNSGVSCKQVNN